MLRLTQAHTFIGNEVRTRLAARQIYFPAANSPAVAAPEFAAMRPYGGQQLTTGAQAEVYADHFIANHLKAIGGGKTYAQLSAEATAQPANAKLAAQVDMVFKGETLRGLLLNAYAFGTMGTITGIAAFIAAAVMLILGGLGLIHARSTSPDTDLLSGHTARTPNPGTAPVPATAAAATASPHPPLIRPARLTAMELPASPRDVGPYPARVTKQWYVKACHGTARQHSGGFAVDGQPSDATAGLPAVTRRDKGIGEPRRAW